MKISIPSTSVNEANKQISIERLNESKYLVMESFFSRFNLNGFRQIMRRQADGEAGHARKIIDFLDDRNANYMVETLPFKLSPFKTIGEWLNFWLDTEMQTTKELISREMAAMQLADQISVEFWREMIKEQQEEEKEPMYYLTRAEELGILDLNLEQFNTGNPIDYIKRQSLINLDNEIE